ARRVRTGCTGAFEGGGAEPCQCHVWGTATEQHLPGRGWRGIKTVWGGLRRQTWIAGISVWLRGDGWCVSPQQPGSWRNAGNSTSADCNNLAQAPEPVTPERGVQQRKNHLRRDRAGL